MAGYFPCLRCQSGVGKQGHLDFMDIWYPIQVKQQDKVGRPDIDKFEAAMMREERTKDFLSRLIIARMP